MNAVTTHQAIDLAIADLIAGARSLVSSSLDTRIATAEACLEGVISVAERWQQAGCEAKRSGDTAVGRAEELLTGPIATLRYLRLIIKTLGDLKQYGKPQLPGRPRQVAGQLRVPVFPTPLLFDGLAFRGLKGDTWLEPGVTTETIFGSAPARLLRQQTPEARVELVLGAGNVSSIAITDALTKIFQDDCTVLLKMNPVNEYLGPVFQDALQPLIQCGWLRIMYGAAAEGTYATQHPQIGSVHITGSTDTHEAIVWGCDAAIRQQRKQAGDPLLTKPISSELGNVTPWIIVPGNYSARQLASQAESIAASITNNASFNCVATKMILTARNWSQRDRFLGMLRAALERTALRYAYYPGAADRFAQFSGGSQAGSHGRLPWTVRAGVNIKDDPLLFQRESFVCVAGETQLEADSPSQFLQRAVDFANQQMTGTLAVELTVPDDFRRRESQEFDRGLQGLRYGTIGVNQWAGLSFAWMSPPWGGYPGATLADVQSGIGSVHNTYLLQRPQKTVIYAPLCMSPKPIWFSTHRHPDKVAQRLLALCAKPSALRLPALLAAALTG
ncbi:MAG: aldehyde dehydrogenase [Pirellulaceae bacterium]|nr:aldehyde dehydrogenase [Pirellulaceae bacterium]